MTTIVVSKNGIASDTKATFNDTYYNAQKIYEIEHMGKRTFIGFSGDSQQAAIFLDWIQNGSNQLPKFDEDKLNGMSAITINEDGLIMLWNNRDLVPTVVKDEYFSIGSGQHAALAAMALGSSIEQAVVTAMQIDVHSGGAVDAMYFENNTAEE